jgi:hypothetical protein
MEINEKYDDLQIIKDLIKRRRLQMLVHSYIYYKLNDNIISNATFDMWAEELIDLQEKYPEISKEVELYDIFSEFNIIGDAIRLPLEDDSRIANRARWLLQEDRRRRK